MSKQCPDMEKNGIKTGKKSKIKVKKIIIKVKEKVNDLDQEPSQKLNPVKDQIKQETSTLWDISSVELYRENKHCKKKKWDVYSKRFVPWSVAICGLVCAVYILIAVVIPNMFSLKHTDWYWIFGTITVFSFLPTLWLNWVRNRDDKLVAYYKKRIELITHILKVRGDL